MAHALRCAWVALGAALWAGPATAQDVSQHGWRLVHPLPVADTLRDVHVMEDGQVWIVGDHGTLLQIDRGSGAVTRVPIPNTPTVASVFDDLDSSFGGTSPPTAQEFPGSQYMPLDLTTIAARGPKDVWIAADTSGLARWDGSSWSWHKDHTMNSGDVLGFDPSGALWTWGGFAISFGSIKQQGPRVVGTSGSVTFSDGPILPNDERIRGIARQGDTMWAVGFTGTLGRSVAGGKFTLLPPPDPERPQEDFWSIWMNEAGTDGILNARYRVFRKRGDGFVLLEGIDGAVTDVFGVPGDDAIWIVGEHVHRLVGDTVTKVEIDGWDLPDKSVFRLDGERIEAVHGRAADDVWMVGAAGLILHWNGAALKQWSPKRTEHDLVGLVWEGEDGWRALSEDGQFLTGTLSGGVTGREASPSDDPDSFQRLPSGELVVHEVCDKLWVQSPKGGKWKQLPEIEGEGCIKHLGGLSSKDLWAAGSADFVDGKVFRLEGGGKWKRVPVPTEKELGEVAVEPDGTVWIGGYGILLRGKKGAPPVVLREHEFDDYKGLLVTGPDALWIAANSNEIGSAGLLLRWEGGALKRHEWLTANWLDGVVVANGTVWAVGLGGVGVRSTDDGFEPIDTGTGATLRAIYAHPSGALIAIGDDGAILQRDP